MKIEKCPFCGGEQAIKARYIGYGSLGLGSHNEYRVVCKECRASSDEYKSEAKAIAAWNRRADPESKPLTLDEIILRCTPKAAELLKSGQLGAIKVCAVSESIHPTNADRIRSMSDEELANVISAPLGKVSYGCYRCLAEGFCHSGECEQAWLDWLKQPLKEE